MNKHNAADYLPLVQALAEGKTIQSRLNGPLGSGQWDDHEEELMFSMPAYCYRIKPEPRKAWVWWPPGCSSPFITTNEARATNWQLKAGGHITEVTE